MPAKSKTQQRLFGMVDAYKKGELENPSKEIKDIAKNMSTKEVKKFAKTKQKGLPEKVSENTIRLTEQQLMRIVQESVHRIISEAESEGWVVDSSEAQEAYNLAVQEMGEETINSAIVGCLGDEALAQCLAYIFRMYDFRKWKSRFE
jgi:predicted RND superfamily exporter protein